MKRRFLSLALAVALLFSMLPCVSIVASGSVNVENDASNETIIDSGTCGDNLNWTLDDEGTLTISGAGDMEDYDQGTAPWNDIKISIKEVVVEDGVTSIGRNAFYDCTNLTSATIPVSVTSIGNYAFNHYTIIINGSAGLGSSAIHEVYYTGTAEQWAQINGSIWADIIYYLGEKKCGSCGDNLIWELSDDGVLTISGTGKMEDYDKDTIPWNDIRASIVEVVVEQGVTYIGSYAFTGCYNLTCVTIPTSVTGIGSCAISSFNNPEKIYYGGTLEQLRAITIEEGNSVRRLPFIMQTDAGEYVGGICGDNATWSLIDGVLTIYGTGEMEFFSPWEGVIVADAPWEDYWESIKTINIDDGITSIAAWAFYECSNFTEITIPASITGIGGNAFSGCSGLRFITFQGDAPVFYASAMPIFRDVIATAYYPAGNSTWTSDVMQGYAGDIAWVPYTQESGGENAVLTGITVITLPTKTQYRVGESLDTTGLTLIATYSDGSTETVTEGFTTSGFSSAAVGTKTITVTYEGYTATFTVEVKAAEPEVIFGEEALHNLRLQDLTKIGYAFSITTDKEVDVYGVLIWTGDADAEVTVDTEGVQNKTLTYDSGFYTAVSDGIYAQRLNVIHYAKPYVKIGDQYIYGSVDTYSPLTYAQTILDGTDEELKQLMIDLLNYGAYAQLYFAESNKEAAPAVLVNDILTDEQKIMNWSDDLKVATPTATKDTANTLDTKWYGTNLNLLDAIQMNMAATGDIAGMYYWTEDAYNSAVILDGASASGQAVIRTDGDYTIGGITGIVAQSVNNVYYVCGYDANGNIGAIRADSVAAYATRLLESAASTEATVNLAKALLVYGNSAADYFAQNN